MTKRREEELLKAIRNLSERTEGFTNLRLIVIGGYALRLLSSFQGSRETATSSLRRRMVGIWIGWKKVYLKAMLLRGRKSIRIMGL